MILLRELRLFQLDGLESESGEPIAVKAYWSGETHNGWEMPYFTEPQALAFASAFNSSRMSSDGVARLEASPGRFVVCDEGDSVVESSDPVQALLPDGKQTQVYAIGSGRWLWEIARFLEQ